MDLSSYRSFFVTASILGLHNQSAEYSIWIYPFSADLGASGSHSMFSGLCSLSVRYAEGPGECGSGVLVREEVD